MAQACSPLALVSVAVAPDMHAITVCFATLPLSDVRVAVLTAPYPVALFNPAEPLAVIYLAVSPCEDSLAVCLAIHEFALIGVPVDEPLIPSAVPLVVLPLALINPAIVVYYDTLSIAFPVPQLALVHRVLVLLDPEGLTGLDYLVVELVTFHLVINQVLLLLR